MEELRPDHIMAVGAGYANAKVLLSAVGLGLFTELGDTAMTAEQIAAGLGLVVPWTSTDAARARRIAATVRLPV